MFETATLTGLTVLVAFSLVLYAYLKRKINTSAFLGTLGLGVVILLALGLEFGYAGLLLLLAFFVFGNLVTKYKYEKKELLGVAEGGGGGESGGGGKGGEGKGGGGKGGGSKGMRDINNVLGNGLSPLVFAVFYGFSQKTVFLLGFSGAVATACADTFSTEIGQADGGEPRLITTLKKVPVGTNGGVSLAGLGAALLGSGLISLAALAFVGDGGPYYSFFLFCIFSGFVGCVVDSLLGASVEDRRPLKLNKHQVNILATLFGGVFAIFLGQVFGM